MQEKYWKYMVQIKAWIFYLDLYAEASYKWDKWINILGAIASSTSIAAWAIWQNFNVKVSPNCKYGYEGYSRSDMGSNSEKRSTTYSEVKKSIKFDRDCFTKNGYANNFTDSYIKIKNGKVVKVVYCVLF